MLRGNLLNGGHLRKFKISMPKNLNRFSELPEELKDKIQKYVDDVIAIPNIEDAVKYTLENAKDDDIIISAGSLYMIGTVRTLVK